MFPKNIRVSIGTVAALGLKKILTNVESTTAYFMTFTDSRCIGNCSFCSQARESNSEKDNLSRVMWPIYALEDVLNHFKSGHGKLIQRICIQVINYPDFINDVEYIVKSFRAVTLIPLSVDSCPLKEDDYKRLKNAGVEMIGIPLDAATPEIFEKVKGKKVAGPYLWEGHFQAIEKVQKIFGSKNVLTNLIIGLGETEKEAIQLIQEMKNKGVKVALFAFTPLPNTPLQNQSPPELISYRKIQLARYLITNNTLNISDMVFTQNEALKHLNTNKPLMQLIGNGEAFMTSGCPGCNRPYYNERPRGPLYNYPRSLTSEELTFEIMNLERALND